MSTSFVLPNLEKICLSTLTDIVGGKLPASEAHPYAKSIISHGGIQVVARSLRSYILPEIQALQGKTITCDVLHTVWREQANQGPWHTAGSDMEYIDFITDDREPGYFRLYTPSLRAIPTNNWLTRLTLRALRCPVVSHTKPAKYSLKPEHS